MVRYLPGIILAVFGALAYAIGCSLYLAYRREKDPARKSKPLMIYGLAMIALGVLALGGGLYALEMNQIHALGQ
jgi:drug/metabolite transporter (DMT)-like permease